MTFRNLWFRLEADLQGSSLLGDMEESKLPLYNLIIAGIATPYVHNNTIHYDHHGECLVSFIKQLHNIQNFKQFISK